MHNSGTGVCTDSHISDEHFVFWGWNYSKSSWNLLPYQRDALKLPALRARYRCCHSRGTNLTWQHLEPGSSEDLRCLRRLRGVCGGISCCHLRVWPPVKYGDARSELWLRVAAKVSRRNVKTSALKCPNSIMSSPVGRQRFINAKLWSHF